VRFLRATWILFAAHLKGTLFSKRFLVALIVAAIPSAVALLILWVMANVEDVNGPPPVLDVGWALTIQVLCPLLALVLGSASVSEEVEDRTISFVLTRPVPRPALLLGRWLVCVVLMEALLLAGSLGFFALMGIATAEHPERALEPEVARCLLQTTALGGLVYSALFAAIGTRFKRAMMIGLGYVFAVEGFLANLPGSNQKLTVQYYLRSWLVHDDPELIDWAGDILDFVPLEGEAALLRMGLILVVALGLGAWILSRRQYELEA
jgi:ABC-2 type transport system permease protein